MDVGVDDTVDERKRDDVLRSLHAAGRRRRFARREVVFHEGDLADSLHLLVKGRIAVRVATSLGSAVTLDVVGPGDVVGELAVLVPGRRAATVVALEPVETMEVSASSFTGLRDQAPAVVELLIRVLAERNRQLVGRLAEVASVGAEARVLRRLVEVVHLYADGDGEAVVPLTQDDLASLAATTRETVNRVLRREADGGSIRLARGRITVVDAARLRERSGGP